MTVGFFAVLVIQLAAGNLISAHWPERVDLTQMSSRMVSSASGFAVTPDHSPAGGNLGVVALAAWYWQLPWLPLAFALAIFAGAFKLYSYLLDRASAYTFAHSEEIAGNLGA